MLIAIYMRALLGAARGAVTTFDVTIWLFGAVYPPPMPPMTVLLPML